MSSFFNINFQPVPQFLEMSQGEMKKMQMTPSDNTLSLYNKKKGVMISLAHKKINGLLGRFTDKKSMRKTLIKEYQNTYPSMTEPEEFEVEVAGDTRYGFRCQYTAGNVKLFSEVVSIVEKGHYITISASCRFNERGYASASLAKLLNTIELN